MLKVVRTAAMSNNTSRENALAQTGATHWHVQLGLTDKVRAINGLVVCCVVWLGFMIYGSG